MSLIKKFAVSGIALVFAAGVATAEPVSKKERHRLTKHLKASESHFLKSVAGLSDAQWAFKPSEDRWSIAECAEHIAVTEGFLLQAVRGALETTATAEILASANGREDEVVAFMLDRSKKFSAPEMVAPTGRWEMSTTAAVDSFKADRIQALELTRGNTSLRSHTVEHPAFGAIDAYAWLFLLSSHTDRHVEQIKEVKAAEGFPKS